MTCLLVGCAATIPFSFCFLYFCQVSVFQCRRTLSIIPGGRGLKLLERSQKSTCFEANGNRLTRVETQIPYNTATSISYLLIAWISKALFLRLIILLSVSILHNHPSCLQNTLRRLYGYATRRTRTRRDVTIVRCRLVESERLGR